MTIKLGHFFPKKSIDEPFLDLSDKRWTELEGGYRHSLYDASIALRRLEHADSLIEANEIYKELWNELHHQGDVGLASYYAVPHLVRIAITKQLVDYNVLGLVSLIEICRHKNNPSLPKALYPAYNKSIKKIGELAVLVMDKEWDLSLANCALTAIALSKDQLKLASAIFNLDDEDRIDEALEKY